MEVKKMFQGQISTGQLPSGQQQTRQLPPRTTAM